MKNRYFGLLFATIISLPSILICIFIQWSCTKNPITPPAPVITSISPTSGPEGTVVTITGSNFNSTPASNAVTFDSVSSIVSAATSIQLTTTVPASALTGPVEVAVNGQNAIGPVFTVFSQPTITSLSSTSGPVGMTIMITGTHFSTTPASNDVTFHGTAATVTTATATVLTVKVPAEATTGVVSVAVNGLSAAGPSFTVLIPTITDLEATYGRARDTLYVDGTGFDPTATDNTIIFTSKIDGTTVDGTVISATATRLFFTVPVAGTVGVPYSLAVSVNGQAVDSGVTFGFTTFKITGISPTSGPVGTTITVTGIGIDPNISKDFAGIGCGCATFPSTATTSQFTLIVTSDFKTGAMTISIDGSIYVSGPVFTVQQYQPGAKSVVNIIYL